MVVFDPGLPYRSQTCCHRLLILVSYCFYILNDRQPQYDALFSGQTINVVHPIILLNFFGKNSGKVLFYFYNFVLKQNQYCLLYRSVYVDIYSVSDAKRCYLYALLQCTFTVGEAINLSTSNSEADDFCTA